LVFYMVAFTLQTRSSYNKSMTPVLEPSVVFTLQTKSSYNTTKYCSYGKRLFLPFKPRAVTTQKMN